MANTLRIALMLLSAALSACAITSPSQRLDSALALANAQAWQMDVLDAGAFDLVTMAPVSPPQARHLTIYLEGDGFAWVNASQPSLDPTPMTPLALKLALRHPDQAVAYVARPCQFTQAEQRRHCHRRYWTSDRFAEDVVAATDSAISQLKHRFGARSVELVGYSGGGAVAALVAARRTDVARLVTVAGNLDTATWAAKLQITPLTGSLNPADAWQALQGLPQSHFMGAQDPVVPASVAEAYQNRFPHDHAPQLIVIDGFDHHCCWVAAWPELLQTLPPLSH